jgi:microcystin-dependent protein
MSEPYVGEIRMVAFNFAPNGWAFCDGSLLSISDNEVLFALIGTTYGGDGQNTFALPNLQGRMPVHMGSEAILGELSGTESVTLDVGQMPIHSHALMAQAGTGHQASPANGVWAASQLHQFSGGSPASSMGPVLLDTGGEQPHNNMPPFLTLTFIISLFGIFPSQN